MVDDDAVGAARVGGARAGDVAAGCTRGGTGVFSTADLLLNCLLKDDDNKESFGFLFFLAALRNDWARNSIFEPSKVSPNTAGSWF